MFYIVDGGGLMKYNVVSLNGGNQFDLSGVRFEGKSFIFWKNKNTDKITEVVVVFDQKYGNQKLRDGVAIVSLQGLKDYKDIMNAINIFKDIVKDDNIQFHFIVANEQEEKMTESLGASLGINYVVQNINKKEQLVQKDTLVKMEEEIKRKPSGDLSAGGDKLIEKYDNGVMKQITVHGNKAYENVNALNTEEEKVSLLREWMKDPKKAYELSKLSVEARNELLMQAINANKREYRLESASELGKQSSEFGQTTREMASQSNGKANTELGIGVDDKDKISVIEQHGNKVEMVNPTVTSSEISSGGLSVGASSRTSIDYSDNLNNVSVNETQVQKREDNVGSEKYYIDGDSYIFNGTDLNNAIGKDGDGEFEVIYDGNERFLFENSSPKGKIEDYPLDLSLQNTKSKGKTLVYKKEKMDFGSNDSNKSGGFVSLPVIIFVISFLLLVGSGIILFMMK